MGWRPVADLQGPRGLSAYEVAVEQGFVGTFSEWTATLTGPVGPPGPPPSLTVLSTTTGPSDPTPFELRGTGMPNGVRSAPVGTYYTDQAGTNGAWRWMKKSGTGNTGWEVVSGDTGSRLVTMNADGVAAYPTGTLKIRRIDTTITVALVGANTSSAVTDKIIYVLPSGFAVTETLAAPVAAAGVSVGLGYVWNNTNISVTQTAGNWRTFTLVGTTNQAWPSALPGTPA